MSLWHILPTDELLNAAARLLEQHIGDDNRLARELRHRAAMDYGCKVASSVKDMRTSELIRMAATALDVTASPPMQVDLVALRVELRERARRIDVELPTTHTVTAFPYPCQRGTCETCDTLRAIGEIKET